MQYCKSLCTLLLLQSPFAFSASLSLPGVGNFHQVDEHVYRGAQPSNDGFKNLAKLGVKIVVDLREAGDRAREEEKLVSSEGMRYVGIPMNGLHAPAATDVAKALDLLEGSSSGAVFVHCRRGADRTGSVIACYRVEHDHWKNDQALKEARSLGMSRLEFGMQQFILHYAPRNLATAGFKPPVLSDALASGALAPSLPTPAAP